MRGCGDDFWRAGSWSEALALATLSNSKERRTATWRDFMDHPEQALSRL
jgi:hypothetical protein